ncbi:MAG: RecQ family ATP-dependent DNA helicase [Sphingobacteriales bacterium]|nr:RecQ family ATP-dependent DNA helicase [Sphingobacteriales bacterium]
MLENLHQILKEKRGYDAFRPLQFEIMQAVLQGFDTLALLPTGGGKSVCYQVPALTFDEGELCLVISPLIALMKDQVQNLKAKNIAAEAIFSGLHPNEANRILQLCLSGKCRILYVSPERIHTALFKDFLTRIKLSFIAVDEAHCISQWGYDFRPAYLKIPLLRQLQPHAPVLALTASATTRVRNDIADKLQLASGYKIYEQSFTRSNLSYSVLNEDNKKDKLLTILKKISGCALVYTNSRALAQETAQFLRKNGLAADFYHAGLTTAQRNQKQTAWMKDHIRIMVATNAFGMGIDKPNVRLVVHISPPTSLEAYYQEAGRAGRDGKKSFAVLLYQNSDGVNLQKLIVQRYPNKATVLQTYIALCNACQLPVGAGQGQNFDFDLDELCDNFKLPILPTWHALKILEEHGYIALSDAADLPARLLITASRNELYEVEVANIRLNPYIKMLLRLYGGSAFVQYVAINERQIAKQMSVPIEFVKNALTVLHKQKLIDYLPQAEQPQVSFIEPRIAENNLAVNEKLMQFRQTVFLNNINAILNYVNTATICRNRQIVAYFGETTNTDCGICDVCIQHIRMQKAEQQQQLATQTLLQMVSQYYNNNKTTTANNALTTEILLQQTELQTKLNKQVIINALRWLIDNDEIKTNETGIFILPA